MVDLKNESQRIDIADFLQVPKDILNSSQSQRSREDAFCLLYIRLEMQLRKLVCYLLRSEPHLIHWNFIVDYVSEHNDWDPDKWLNKFDLLRGNGEFKRIVDNYNRDFNFRKRKKNLDKYRQIRNKLFHGVHVREDFFRLFNKEDRIQFLIEWIETVAISMDKEIGYDGIQRLSALKTISRNYQFSKTESYEKVKQYIDSQLKFNRQ